MALIASRGIGNAGTLEIHDDGWTVHARIRSSDGQTRHGALPFRIANGGGWSQWLYANYPAGSPWVTLWADGVPSSRSIGVQVGDTGTWGFGAGGELWGSVYRTPPATVPESPLMTGFGTNPDQITSTSMRVRFNGRGNGGSAITGWELQRATNAAFTQGVVTIGSSGTSIVTDLIPGTRYWWRARGKNAVGYSAWSPDPVSAETLAGGRVKDAGSWRDATPWLKVGGSWVRVRPYEKQSGSWRALR